MNTLLCDLFWTDVFPSIWWGLIVAVVVIWALYIVSPLIKDHINSTIIKLQEQHRHEKEMKDDTFGRELKWHLIKRGDTISDLTGFCNDELKSLREKVKEIGNGNEFEKEILQTKINAYEEILKTINK